MSEYAKNTEVTREKSIAEIERTLMRYGATAFSYAWQGMQAMVMFECKARRVRFIVPMPDRAEKRFTSYMRGSFRHDRTPEAAYKEWEQACRQRWRALALVVKAKLEAVEAGITSFEEEFLAHMVLPNGQSVATWMIPQVAEAYETGHMPPMLALAGPTP